MGAEYSQELLYIPGREKNYGLELERVIEICKEFQISKFPCLPPYYIGMYNYKGEIVPVIQLEEAKETKIEKSETSLLLVLRCENCLLALAVQTTPSMISMKDVERIKGPDGQRSSDIWREKGIYRCNEKLFSLLDIEQSVRERMAHR